MNTRRKSLISLFFIAFLLLIASRSSLANVIFVNAGASGTNDGSSWTNAYTDLQNALSAADSGDAVWVAAGTYKPTAGASRAIAFQLVNGVAVYGGFEGGESSLGERDWAANVTILSGDIGVADDITDNSYHVVVGNGTDGSTILDGFTVTSGRANGIDSTASGGGMFNRAGSPTLANVIFAQNYALQGGAGMYNKDSSSPTLTGVLFFENVAGNVGGGMHNSNSSSPILTNVTFSRNIASYGGAMRNNLDSNPTLINSILWDDSAAQSGDEIYNNSSTPFVSYSLVGSALPIGCVDGGHNVFADPLFIDADAGNFRLITPGSPAFNAGSNDAPNLPPTDLDGNPRVMTAVVDMGAYESQLPCPSGPVLYVDASATGANDGTSWTDAVTDFQTALGLSGCPGITEIWVAAGTYKPSRGSNRSASFQLLDGVALYGGFAGTETARSERDWLSNETILSGDIGIVASSADNSYHVVTGSGTNATAVLDGFTIMLGRANGNGTNANGGGIYIDTGGPTLRNVTVQSNSASYGGGIYNDGGTALVEDAVISGNSATYGGGMYNDNGGNLTLRDAVFSGNSTLMSGGGMYNKASSPALANVVFYDNSTSNVGGAMSNNNASSPVLTNVTFSQNAAAYGGAMRNDQDSNPTIVNTILWGDYAALLGKEIYNTSSAPVISYSLVGSTWPSGSIDGGHNINADPLFVDAGAGDLRLSSLASPAYNAGSNAAPNLPSTDLDGNPRIRGIAVDMGAYEYDAPAGITLLPSPLMISEAPANETTCDTLFVINEGGASCTIAGIYGCTTGPFAIDTTMTAHELAPGDTTVILVCVTPTSPGSDTCSVTIVSDAANSPTAVQVTLDVVTAAGTETPPMPFRIVAVSPNPFNPSTTIHFTLPAAMPVTAEIWSVSGARVRALAHEQVFGPGDNRLSWDGRNDRGTPVASGVYFIRLKTRLGLQTTRAVLLK